MTTTHAHKLVSTVAVLNILGGIFAPYLGLRFSGRHNSKYGCADLLAHLAAMCRDGTSAEKQCRDGRDDPESRGLPSARWTLGMVRSVEADRMLAGCTNMLRATVRRMKKYTTEKNSVNSH